MTLRGNKFYVFGGGYKYNGDYRECLNNIMLFDIETNKWELVEPKGH